MLALSFLLLKVYPLDRHHRSLPAGSVAAFLHENLPHFVEEDAVGDLAACLDYLGAADVMASGRRWGGEPLLPPLLPLLPCICPICVVAAAVHLHCVRVYHQS